MNLACALAIPHGLVGSHCVGGGGSDDGSAPLAVTFTLLSAAVIAFQLYQVF
jgi:hypothetical protein